MMNTDHGGYETIIVQAYTIQGAAGGACDSCGTSDGKRRHVMALGMSRATGGTADVIFSDVYWDQAHGIWNQDWQQTICMPCAVVSIIQALGPHVDLGDPEKRRALYDVLVPCFTCRGHILALCSTSCPGDEKSTVFLIDLDSLERGDAAMDVLFMSAGAAVAELGAQGVAGLVLHAKGLYTNVSDEPGAPG